MNAMAPVPPKPTQSMWSANVSAYVSTAALPVRRMPVPGASLGQTTPQRWQQIANFYHAFILGLDCGTEMVADDAMDPPAPQVWEQALDAVLGFAGYVPLPLVTPLQLGGVSVEWHVYDIDLEIRFRADTPPFVLTNDVRGEYQAFRGRDPNLAHVRKALATLAARSV